MVLGGAVSIRLQQLVTGSLGVCELASQLVYQRVCGALLAFRSLACADVHCLYGRVRLMYVDLQPPETQSVIVALLSRPSEQARVLQACADREGWQGRTA